MRTPKVKEINLRSDKPKHLIEYTDSLKHITYHIDQIEEMITSKHIIYIYIEDGIFYMFLLFKLQILFMIKETNNTCMNLT
jgi:hypothetical protein